MIHIQSAIILSTGAIVGIITASAFAFRLRKKAKWSRTNGIVRKVREKWFPGGDSDGLEYAPVVCFTVPGIESEMTFQDPQWMKPAFIKVGDVVEVAYDSKNPREAFISSGMRFYFPYLIVLGIAVFLIIYSLNSQEEEPNQAPEPTPTAVTAAAYAPAAPASGAAHL